MSKVRRFGRLYAAWAPEVGLVIVGSGSHSVNLWDTIRPLRRAATLVRRCFPYFYAVGLRCCDHAGRVMSTHPEWGLNWWHLGRRLDRWDGAGDGETYTQVPAYYWFRWVLRLRAKGKRCSRDDD